jgi:hypothetical protein
MQDRAGTCLGLSARKTKLMVDMTSCLAIPDYEFNEMHGKTLESNSIDSLSFSLPQDVLRFYQSSLVR